MTTENLEIDTNSNLNIDSCSDIDAPSEHIVQDPVQLDTAQLESFESLVKHPQLLEALNKLNIQSPSAVQARSIPLIIAGQDLVVEAQTGSGKTLAFVLPILERIMNAPLTRATQVLVMAPTRELAQQVKEVIVTLTPDVVPACIIGGANMQRQIRHLKKDGRIVIGTPGRIQDLINQGQLSLEQCKAFVLDEADEMLSMGFAPSVREILSYIPKQAQGLFFSATISTRVAGLANSFLTKHETIEIETKAEDQARIEHFFCTDSGGVTTKTNTLSWLIESQNIQSAIIFCNTKSETEMVENILTRKGYDAKRINSDLGQNQRAAVLDSLRDGTLRYLIATDVAARGIDIKELETVINYSIHKQPEVYVHRTGRTGRAGATGRAISIVGPQDFSSFYSLRKQLGLDVTEIKLPGLV